MPSGSKAIIEFGPDTRYGFRTSQVPATVPVVPILVAGMKQNSTYHMRAVITRPDGRQEFDSDHVFQTGEAPAGRIPVMAVTLPSGQHPSPGVEMLCLNPQTNNPGNPLRVLALDPAGNLIWYYDFDPDLGTAQPVKMLPNGNLLMVLFGGTTGPGGMVREINLAGETVHEFTVTRLNQWLSAAGYDLHANAIHHDIAMLPNGHLLVLVNIHREFRNLPGRPGVTTVLGDAVVDLDPSYRPVWVWSSFDHLDINRHPMLFPDWTHTNTIVYSPADGNILLSLRNQSWVVKIDYRNGRGTGKILWRLGYQGDFKLLNSDTPADWFFAQHDADLMNYSSKDGNFQLALFDNGNDRYPDFDGNLCPSVPGGGRFSWPALFGSPAPPCYSRPTLFDVNENSRTAQLVWSKRVPYSYWGGVNMRLPNGNMFFDVASMADPIEQLANGSRSLVKIGLEGTAVVGLVLLVFFWKMPGAVVPFVVAPVAVIFAFVPLLGGMALAIAIVADASLAVMREAPKSQTDGGMRATAIAGAKRLARPSFFVLILAALAFMPILKPLDRPSAEAAEVTSQMPAKTVWELDVHQQESYRTEHWPSLYPGVQW